MDYWSFATGDQEIEFTPRTDADTKTETKGVITGTTYPVDEPFAVTAWYLGADASDVNKKWNDFKGKSVKDGGPIQYIPSLNNSGMQQDLASKIERIAQTSYWKNRSAKFYWPALGSLSFFIYSPYSLLDEQVHSNITVSCTPSDGLRISDFDVTPAGGRLDSKGNPVEAGKQWNVDFMVTPLLENYTRDSIGTAVNAVFKHQLSTIQFYSKRAKDLGDDIQIYLKEIRIKRILTVASYSMYENDDRKWSRKGQNAANEESEYIIFESNENNGKGLELTGSSAVTNSLTGDDPILVLPQILPLIYGSVDSTTATLVIKYTKVSQVENPSPTSEADKLIPEIRESEYYGDFKSIFEKWSPNKSYSYTLSIGGLETIHWDPSVSPFTYQSTVLRPDIFDKNGQVSDDIVLSLIKQDTVLKYNNEYSKYGNYNFQVNEDCQGDIRDNLYFMWYQLRRPKSNGDKWVYPYSYSDYSYNWYASIEGLNGSFTVNTDQQMDPYSLFKQVCGAGESPYNTEDNCRNNVVFKLKKCTTNNKYYIYHPVTDRYLQIDFSKSSNGIGNSDCATFVSNKDAATPLCIDFIGVYTDNQKYDNTTDGVQIYFDTYTDVYGPNDGTGNGIISHTTDAVTKQHYYVLGVDITRTYKRNYITFENGTVSFRTLSDTPVQIEKQYLYISEQSTVDMSVAWDKAHTEVGKLLSNANNIPNIGIDDYIAIMNLIPLNGTIKTEQKMIVDDDSELTDFELRNVHGNADTYGSSNVAGQYKFGDIIKVTGDVYAKVDGKGPGLIEKDVALTVTRISGEKEGVLYGEIQADGSVKVVSGGSTEGHALVNCIAQLKNHPKYGSITPADVNYIYDGYDRISYALVLDPVDVNANKTVTALGTVYYVYNGIMSDKVAETGCEVAVTAVGNTSYASVVSGGQIKGGNVSGKFETTYQGKYTYTDKQGAKYNLSAENGKVTVHSLSYNLVLNPVVITAYYPNNGGSYTATATGSVYEIIDGTQQPSPIQNAMDINVTINTVGDGSLATFDKGTFTANTNKKYGSTTYSAVYEYNGTTVVPQNNGSLTVNTVEYNMYPNTITVSGNSLNLNNNPATGTLKERVNHGSETVVGTYNISVTSLVPNNQKASLSSNTITALNTGNTAYYASYLYSNNNGYSYQFTGMEGTVDVTAVIKYTLTLNSMNVNVSGSVTPTATLYKTVNGNQLSSTPVNVKATGTGNSNTAKVSNGQLTGVTAGTTTYSAQYEGEMGTIPGTNGSVTVINNGNTLWQGNPSISFSSWSSYTVYLNDNLYPNDVFKVVCKATGSNPALQITVGSNRYIDRFSSISSNGTTLVLSVPKWWPLDYESSHTIKFEGCNVEIIRVYTD